MTKLYKIVSTDFRPIHGGSGQWHAPKGSRPGKWMPKVGPVMVCNVGYRLIPARAIIEWLPQKPTVGYLCKAEGRGDSDDEGDKIAFAEARLLKVVGLLDERSVRLAAADMAERVLPIFYKVLPNDKRPAEVIQAARDYAEDKIDAAAWNAARNAAQAAAWDATWPAARYAAGAAAGVAAGVAAGAAAWAATMDAAGDAARAAARNAAQAATWEAAWDATWPAARHAAGVAAGFAAGVAAQAANAKIIIARAKEALSNADLDPPATPVVAQSIAKEN